MLGVLLPKLPVLLIANFYAGQLLLNAFAKRNIMSAKVMVSFIIIFASLFMYQSAVTAFILPFLFTTVIKNNFDRRVALRFIVFTLICYGIYFLSFKWSLQFIELNASHRTSLNVLNLPKKSC